MVFSRHHFCLQHIFFCVLFNYHFCLSLFFSLYPLFCLCLSVVMWKESRFSYILRVLCLWAIPLAQSAYFYFILTIEQERERLCALIKLIYHVNHCTNPDSIHPTLVWLSFSQPRVSLLQKSSVYENVSLWWEWWRGRNKETKETDLISYIV